MARKPPAEPEQLEREVEVHIDPGAPPDPWFTVHLGFNIGIALEWCFAITVGAALLTIGTPDLLDELTALVGRL